MLINNRMDKMKKLLFLFWVTFNAICFSQEIQQNQLIVYGYGSVEKEADIAKLYFSIRGLGPSLELAVKDAQSKILAITTKLFAIGLKESNISTQSFSSNENNRDKAFWSSDKDYEATMSVNITIDSLKLLESTVIIISEHKVNNLSNINFELKNDEEVKLQARDVAVKNAVEKAKIFAANLNIELGACPRIELRMERKNNLL
ncbi:MAG: hypothetical protein CO127_00665 [Ignavibacteria bacterium CG_4_9_14_3_um_filter_36_18]|nr:MAG: hypothetical protein CO127_00665 [Ignavibacteria bacterium CG_4_9_14_3_um_filter_36_18]